MLIGGLALTAGLGLALGLALSGPAPEPPPSYAAGALTTLPPAREASWVEAITDWVVALDRLSRARHEGELPTRIALRERELSLFRQDVLAKDLAPAFGDTVMTALGLLLDRALAAAHDGPDWSEREGAFAESVRALNRALAAHGLAYFFDSYAVRYDTGRVETALYTFRIGARQRFTAADKTIDALHLRRIDRLNLVQFLLGYTSKRMDVAVLLVDKIEAEVAARLGPALVPGGAMPLQLAQQEAPETSWRKVAAKAGQVLREAYYGALPGRQQGLSELGQLLADRGDLVRNWNARLAPRQIELKPFEDLEVSADYRDRFEALTSHEARLALDDLQRRLETEEHRTLFLQLVLRHARAVEVHEVQHRIDYGRDDDFEVPQALLDLLAIPAGGADQASDEVRRIAYELSAYSAELARDPEWARLDLTLLTLSLYDGSGGAEGYGAVLLLEGLAHQLGLAAPRLVGSDHGADLEAVAALHLRLLDEPGPTLARAAAALWEEWFGEPLARLEPQPASPAMHMSPGAGR